MLGLFLAVAGIGCAIGACARAGSRSRSRSMLGEPPSGRDVWDENERIPGAQGRRAFRFPDAPSRLFPGCRGAFETAFDAGVEAALDDLERNPGEYFTEERLRAAAVDHIDEWLDEDSYVRAAVEDSSWLRRYEERSHERCIDSDLLYEYIPDDYCDEKVDEAVKEAVDEAIEKMEGIENATKMRDRAQGLLYVADAEQDCYKAFQRLLGAQQLLVLIPQRLRRGQYSRSKETQRRIEARCKIFRYQRPLLGRR